MTLISIRERSGPGGANATVSFDGQGEYAITVSPPFSEEEEQQLEWYFEQHLRFPFTEQVRARAAAASVAAYGERLFQQIFRDQPEVYGDYKAALQEMTQTLRLPPPRYITVREAGPEHRKTFTVEARVGPELAENAEGTSKKSAGQLAAQRMLECLLERFPPDGVDDEE